MEEEYFSFSPIDKVPDKPGNYRSRDISIWTWTDFYNYYIDSYTTTFGKQPWVSIKQRNSKKKIIEQSYEYWGRTTFKDMIDWMFANHKKFPQWDEPGIGLVCGSHYWAKLIGNSVKKEQELNARWERE